METETTPAPRSKRAKKPSTPRVRKAKDPGILAIEQAAAKQKEEYRKAQASEEILTRIIEKMLPRLTDSHREFLHAALEKTMNAQSQTSIANAALQDQDQ